MRYNVFLRNYRRKYKNGFTLIELLAVILILGIIALIAIPTVNSVIEQSRKGAAESSAKQYVKSVEEYVITSSLMGATFEDRIYTVDELNEMQLGIKGTLPESGIVKVSSGEVIGSALNYGNYSVISLGQDFISKKIADVPKFVIVDDKDGNNRYSAGDKVCANDECFYVLSVNNGKVRMLSEWNLNVGYDIMEGDSYDLSSMPGSVYSPSLEMFVTDSKKYVKINTDRTQVRQNREMRGYIIDYSILLRQARGVVPFSKLSESKKVSNDYHPYWSNDYIHIDAKYDKNGNGYPCDVYDSNSYIYQYVNDYVDNLKILMVDDSISGELLTKADLQSLNCDFLSYSCSGAPSWLQQSSFWTGVAASGGTSVWSINYSQGFSAYAYYYGIMLGVRPVIVINES